jgi:hypothetical protein
VIGIGFGHDEPSMPQNDDGRKRGPALFGPLRTAGIVLALALSVTVGAKAMDRDGLITIQSRYTPKETMQRLETAVKSKGMTVFAHIDHAAGAAEVGMTLRPTDLLIFGSPKGGTPLMQSAQTMRAARFDGKVTVAGQPGNHAARAPSRRLKRASCCRACVNNQGRAARYPSISCSYGAAGPLRARTSVPTIAFI